MVRILIIWRVIQGNAQPYIPLYHSSVKGMYNGIVRVCIRSLYKSSVGALYISQPIHECYIATFKAIDQIAMGPNNAMIYLESKHKQPTIT